jgi:Mn-containing catalase
MKRCFVEGFDICNNQKFLSTLMSTSTQVLGHFEIVVVVRQESLVNFFTEQKQSPLY